MRQCGLQQERCDGQSLLLKNQGVVHEFASVVAFCCDDFCGVGHAGAQYVVGDEPQRPFWPAICGHDHGWLHERFALHDEHFGCGIGRFAAHLSSGV
jgi:hypothetical protein